MKRLAALSLLLAIGCQKFLIVAVDDKQSLQPTFRFHADSVFGLGKTQSAHVSTFTVAAKGEGSGDQTVWQIESRAAKVTSEPTAKPAALAEIKYGNAPVGYATLVAPQVLEWGKTYRVTSSLRVEGDEAVVGAGGEFTPTKR